MQIKTENFLIKSLKSNDLSDDYFLWLKDKDVTRHLFIAETDVSEKQARLYVDSHDGENDFFFGILDHSEKLIGTHSVKTCKAHRRSSMGVMIGDKSYWGKQVVLEVRSAILDFIFFKKECEKAEAGCYKSNLPAIYNFQRLGWHLEGVRREHRVKSDTREDLLLFGLLKKEWHSHRLHD